MDHPVIELQYATRDTNYLNAHQSARLMFILAILSGLCVGVSFLALTGNIVASITHVAVFALTIAFAIRADIAVRRQLAPPTGPATTFGVMALLGLTILALAPFGRSGVGQVEQLGLLMGALAFLLLSIASIRHVGHYSMLADVCASIAQPGLGRSFRWLGWIKTFYELIWLFNCSLTLLLVSGARNRSEDFAIATAIAAFFGALGYGGLWLWMMIAHYFLLRHARPE